MSFETVCIKTRQTIKLREVYSDGVAIASISAKIRATRRHWCGLPADSAAYVGLDELASGTFTVLLFAKF
jgi:hypothetical protein